jgi:Mrp family chromosome partitioning ATPase
VALPAIGPAQVVAQRVEAQASDPRLILVLEPETEQAAAYRVLRHRLDERSCHAVCVASPGHRQGATTLAINLALALGECGRARVALLETNTRAPGLAALLGVQPHACFADQLAAHRLRPNDPWFVQEALSPYLHVGSIRPARSGMPLVDTPPFTLVTEQFRRAGYDYVVFDAAPVLGNADVHLIQEGTDGVLLAAAAGATRSRELRQAAGLIESKKLLGAVLQPGRRRRAARR